MRLAICAIGRLKAGPERELCSRYAERIRRAGPAVGLEWLGLREGLESRARETGERRREEALWLRGAAGPGAAVIALDERGRDLSSAELSALLARIRDEGPRDLAFAIGGPDGHDPAFLDEAAHRLSFGRATWPHQLVRAMLHEQLYRATTILSGHPYHRD